MINGISAKFRTVLSKYDQNNMPKTIAVKGKVFNTVEEAQDGIKDLVNEICHDLASGKVFNKGYDPFGYYVERYNEVSTFIRHQKLSSNVEVLLYDAPSLMYMIHIIPFTCYFNSKSNKITYRSMDLIQFDGKWYVHSAFNGAIIGIIDENESLNEILTQADKIYDELDPNYQIPIPYFRNN